MALLSTSYPEGPGDPAGHFVRAEALTLARVGHEIHVIAPGRLREPRLEPGSAARVTIWGAGGGDLFGAPGAVVRALERPSRLRHLPSFIRGVRRAFERVGPVDRTVAHFLVPCGFPLALASSGALEVVLHGTDVRAAALLPSVVRARMLTILLARGAQFRFVSDELRARLLDGLSSATKAAVARASRVELPSLDIPGIDRPPGAIARGEIRGDDRCGERWVVCARLIRSKRVDLALREAARCGAGLTVVGDGPQRAELEALARSLGVKARFLGMLSRPEALAVIASADLLVHLSEAEGAPTVVREARALGVPVLSTPVGDVPRWAQHDGGISLFTPPPTPCPRGLGRVFP